MDNLSVLWKVPDSNGVVAYASNPGEIVVGGVFLRLFIANPGWTLRKPKEFLAELMNTCLDSMSKDNVEVKFPQSLTKIVE